MDLREELSKLEEKSNEEVVKENKLIQSFNHYINTGEIEPEDKEKIIDIFQFCIDKCDFNDCILLNEIIDAYQIKNGKDITKYDLWKTKCSEKISVRYSQFPNLIKLIIKEYEISILINNTNPILEQLGYPKLHRKSSKLDLAEACMNGFFAPIIEIKRHEQTFILAYNVSKLYRLMYDADFIKDKVGIIYLYMYEMTNNNQDGFILFKGEVQSILDNFDFKRSGYKNLDIIYENKMVTDEIIKNGDKFGIKSIQFDKNNYYFTLEGCEEKGNELFNKRIKKYKQKDLIGSVLFQKPLNEIKRYITNNIEFSAQKILETYELDYLVIFKEKIYLSKKNYFMVSNGEKTNYYQANVLDNVIESERDNDYEIDMSSLIVNPKSNMLNRQKNVMGSAMLGAALAGSAGAIIGATSAMDYNNRNSNMHSSEKKLVCKIRERDKIIHYYDTIGGENIYIASSTINRSEEKDFPSWIYTVSKMLKNAIGSKLDDRITEYILKYKSYDKKKYKEYALKEFWEDHKEEKLKYEQEKSKAEEETLKIQKQIDEIIEKENLIKKEMMQKNTATTELHNKINELKVLYNEKESLGMFDVFKLKKIEEKIELLNTEKKELSKKSKEMTKEIKEQYKKELELIKEKKQTLIQEKNNSQKIVDLYQYYIDYNIIN